MAGAVTRRDFLNGASLTIAAGFAPISLFAAPGASPPSRMGLRGSHEGAYERAHRLAFEGQGVNVDALPVSEEVDLVVVGAGIAGLSAAFLARKKLDRSARVLILDNHDDFGGHATRNEFDFDGRLLLSYGGSESFQSPKAYFSDDVNQLMADLGVDYGKFAHYFDASLYPALGLSRATFFDKETFGRDVLAKGDPTNWVSDDIPRDGRNAVSVEAFVNQFPMPENARRQLTDLLNDDRDPLANMPRDEVEAYLASASYPEFLKQHWSFGPDAIKYFRQRTSDFFGTSVDYVSAGDALAYGYPGRGRARSGEKQSAVLDEPYIYHFPDGNASVARLLVRALIPAVASGVGAEGAMERIVSAQFDYSQLDSPAQATRLRLGATALAMRNAGGRVDVVYYRNGELHRVRARSAIYSGWSMMLPHACKDIPQERIASYAQNVKSPLVYAKVLLRNWTSFVRLGVHDIYAPSGFCARTKLDFPVSMGDYKCPRTPQEPMVAHMVHVAEPEGVLPNARDRARAARAMLLGKPFSEYEAALRDQLQRMLGAGGFEHERDIAAITVNRWSHGYSYSENSLYDAPGANAALIAGARAPIGAIAVANSDTAFSAYLHSAIEEAARAVRDILP